MLDKSSRAFQYVCQLYIVPRWFCAALVQARVSGSEGGGAVVGEGCEGLLALVEAANETIGKRARLAAGGWWSRRTEREGVEYLEARARFEVTGEKLGEGGA